MYKYLLVIEEEGNKWFTGPFDSAEQIAEILQKEDHDHWCILKVEGVSKRYPRSENPLEELRKIVSEV